MSIVGAIMNVLALALLPVAAASACTRTVRWYDDAPYYSSGNDGQVHGFTADLTRAVLQRQGCEARFVEMPFARALAELEAGRLDILPDSFHSPARARFAHFSIPAIQSPNVLFTTTAAAAKFHLATLDELAGSDFRLAVQIGVSYGEHFDALKAKAQFRDQLSHVTLRRNAWKMMSMGRIDGMIADQASGAVELRQLGLSDTIRPSGLVVSTDTAVYAFSKRSVDPAFVAGFNKALAALIADGQYRKIRARHLPCPAGIEVLGCK
jgi:polar amino acid transport system substrate-binding protein